MTLPGATARVRCPECDGSCATIEVGLFDPTPYMQRCPECHGTGEIDAPLKMCRAGYDSDWGVPECGTWYPITDERCPDCGAENPEA